MKPSRPETRIPGFDHEKADPSHDAISSWLLHACAVSGFPEYLMSLASPATQGHNLRCTDIELEPIIVHPTSGFVAGFADALLRYMSPTESARLWIEIKTDDKAIGALVRQVKMYKRLIQGDSKRWLAVLPHASSGALAFLKHAGIGTYIIGSVDGMERSFPNWDGTPIALPPMDADLLSLTARAEDEYQRRTAMDHIPAAADPQPIKGANL